MDFTRIQDLVFEEYKKNGYLENWETAYKIIKESGVVDPRIVDVAEVGLVDTEISEAIEEIRKGTPEKEVTELADAIIRIMTYSKRKNYDLEKAILDKHLKNMKREYLHGKRV